MAGHCIAELLLEQALIELHERERYIHAHRDEFSAMIEEGWEELERGETVSAEEAKQQIAEWKQEVVAKRNAA